MRIAGVFIWSKKIHRLTMWLAIILGIPLSLTGIMMEKSNLFEPRLGIQTLITARSLHRTISTKFALVLAMMMVTGFLMWVIPEITKIKARKQNAEKIE